jgi:hypothetical protein
MDLAVPVETGGQPTMPVWSTLHGQLAPPPINGVQVSLLTAFTAALSVIAGMVTLLLSSLAARLLLNRHRMAAWDDDWRATGPRWNTLA